MRPLTRAGRTPDETVATMRADPAPSRLKYRLERLMLTPLFRLALRVGLPCALGFGAVTWWASVPENREAFNLMLSDMRAQIEQRPEFMVNMMAIEGAGVGVSEDIREILSVDFPISSFDLDLDAMRETVVGLDAVRTASLKIRQGGVLQVDVAERVPVLLWRHEAGLELLDREGVRVGPAARRTDHPKLPVVAGDGADLAVPEALALLRAVRPLQPRLRGLVRMGERRWDVVLDRGQRILLPTDGAVQALERAIAMDQAVDMLARDLVRVDLRLPQRPTIRLTDHAVQELWRIKAIEVGEEE
ncbi:cell division protein FtsQ/DivIB [Aestuariicoccus sp. MJ-SS9]|uniref:cell division protein FtsQ/DivIB n=1 Tax=Aestuariicoccus sp. MJ-SS9 TaxID=3079855 RepID=UPI00290EFB2E|nr:cell division protein FtsQ/DivIB [Aestuariicoccus sp. MJ-SS9]MDU8911160.1 cell division protein FtsQ/DivIB [Aestuariicoccus sp. MJ-SS9]